MDIVKVEGMKKYVPLVVKGLFNTVVGRGPGKIILQTMPIANVAGCRSEPFFGADGKK